MPIVYEPTNKDLLNAMSKPCKYDIELYAAVNIKLANGNTEKIALDCSQYISYIEIQNNFASSNSFVTTSPDPTRDSVFPFISVSMTVPKRTMLLIQEDLDSVIFVISVRKRTMDDPELPASEAFAFIDNVVCKPYNLIKRFVEAPENPQGVTNYSESREANEKKASNQEEINETQPEYDMFFQLFKLEHLSFNKTLNPSVYNNCTVADVILDLINNNCNAINSKFFIDKITNKTRYEQIILPPLNLVQSLFFLQGEYGVFKNGIQVFFDFRFGYIKDRCTVITKNTHNSYKKSLTKTTIELYSPKNDDKGSATGIDGKNMMYYAPDINTFIVRTTQRPGIDSNPIISKELTGEILKFSSTSKEGYRVICRDTAFDTRQNGMKTKENAYWNTNSNLFSETSFYTNMSMNFGTLKFTFPNMDIEAFDINKQVEIVDQTDYNTFKEYEGSYKILSANTIIPYKKGTPSTATSVIVLSRLLSLKD